MSGSINTTDNNEGNIRPIPITFVHRMVAGQAIADLASAVKELVDNALDAGARSVTVRLVSYGGENAPGVDEIEVSDDGTGVPLSDRPLLATKHATSKLSSIDQLYGQDRSSYNSCDTLGFRGEALFSLASICQSFYITTRCIDEPVGQKIYYDHSGNMCPSRTQAVPRKVGTSVFVIKLFDTLPVRRLDLIKRAKTHRLKLFKLLQSYAILCRGIQFRVVDVVTSAPAPIFTTETESSSAQKKRKLVNKTDVKLVTSVNNATFESTVSSVLGCTMLEGMLRIPLIKGNASLDGRKPENPSSPTQPCSNGKNATINCHQDSYWTMEGLISYAPGAAPGGAMARELQLLSINDRPVELLPSLSRMINDTWKSLFPTAAGGKRPACVLALRVPPHMVDVNVSPDKREVILTGEEVIREALQRTLFDLWSKQVSGVFAPHQAESDNLGEVERLHQRQIQQKVLDTVKTISLANAVNQLSPETKSMIRGNVASQLTFCPTQDVAPVSSPSVRNPNNDIASCLDEAGQHSSLDCSQTLVTQAAYLSISPLPSTPSSQKMPRRNAMIHDLSSMSTAQPDILMKFCLTATGNENPENTTDTDANLYCDHDSSSINSIKKESVQAGHTVSPVRMEMTTPAADDVYGATSKMRLSPLVLLSDHSVVDGTIKNTLVAETPEYREGGKRNFTPRVDSQEKNEERHRENQPEKILWSSFTGNNAILRQYKIARDRMKTTCRALRKCYSSNNLSSAENDVGFISEDAVTAKVGESVGIDNEVFCSGLSQKREPHKISLSKEDFSHMIIVGQFNCGFILAMCRNFHLWILDQHACDEKFNFEHLVQNTVLKEQRLLKPLTLELSAQEEHCIVENMSEFEKNGFRFIYDTKKPPRHRLSMTAIPHSGSGGDGKKATLFGKEDVKALCSILGVDDASEYDPHWRGENGKYGNNAVRRYGTGESFNTQDSDMGNKTTAADTSVVGGITGKKLARLPKAIAMFASRACRSSIMIGDALSMPQMESLVRKMRNVDNPWDCAHGRPTVRHVKDLLNVLYEEETAACQLIASSCLGVLSQINEN